MKETNLKPPLCSQHRVPMIWGEGDFAFEDDGVQVVVHHVAAFRCPLGDDIALTPGVTDELLRTIRELVAAVKRTRESASLFGGYEITVA